MESNPSPSISSFVIRFVLDETSLEKDAQPYYRGAIRHIQSDKEINFNTWEDAVAFIQRYVPLETKSDKDNT
jgi:hypothetical protein